MKRHTLIEIRRLAEARKQIAELKESRARQERMAAEGEHQRLNVEFGQYGLRLRSAAYLPSSIRSPEARLAYRGRLEKLGLIIAEEREDASARKDEAAKAYDLRRFELTRATWRAELAHECVGTWWSDMARSKDNRLDEMLLELASIKLG